MTNRRNCRQAIVAIAMILLVFALFAERQPYERYQSVVDRQMFGAPPPGFDPTKNPSEISAKDERAKDQELTKEQEQVKSAIHFSMVNVTPAGDTAVGFTDNSDSKSPKHYYLKVGESRDGWTVKEADALAATMTIAKGEIEVSLTLGGDSASGGGTRKVDSSNKRSGSSASAPGGRPNLLGGASRRIGSFRERRAQRREQREADAKAAAEQKRIAEEREAQREAEREAEKAEREEQRAQLLQIQEELRKTREAKEKADAAKQQDGDNNRGDGE